MRQHTLLWVAAVGLLALGATVGLIEGRRGVPVAGAPGVDQSLPANDLRDVTIPAGTTLTVSLDNSIGSATSRVEDPVRAHLTRPVMVDNAVALPEQSVMEGTVIAAVHSARVKGRASITIRFDAVRPAGDTERFAVRTAAITRTAPGTKKKDALKIGVPAAAGAVIGGLLGGGTGAVTGGVIGGGAGTGYVLATRGSEVGLPRGARLTVRLIDSATLRMHVPPFVP